jgi:hypothetical protein
MVFSDFKESIKAFDSDNLMIKDYFSSSTFLSSVLEFLEFLLNLRKSSRSSLLEFSSNNLEEFMIKEVNKNMDHTQEINPNTSVSILIPIEKLKTSNLQCVCDQCITKYHKCGI